jgi:putative ABC transport system permease protein
MIMEKPKPSPPDLFLRFFRWFCRPRLVDHIEGDLIEVYRKKVQKWGKRRADIKFIIDVIRLFRPGIVKPIQLFKTTNTYGMYTSYFRTGWRNLVKNKGYSIINVSGLAIGMGVAILIALWVVDELTFNTNFKNYDRIAKVWQFVKFDVEKASYDVVPVPLSEELRENYSDFELVSMSGSRGIILSSGTKSISADGIFVEPSFIEMMSVKIRGGSDKALNEINSILLSESLAKNIFGNEDPVNKMVTINNKQSLKVTGVYDDFPSNSAFRQTAFLGSWSFFVANDNDAKYSRDQWDSNSYNIYVQVKPGVNMEETSLKIRDIRMKRPNPPGYKPEFFLHPMSKWHLYSDFRDGKNTGGLIEYVWLFGAIGLFVLALACINFMNLTTARSEKRAREVGIRKSIGSVRSQLVFQFLIESFLVVFIAFLLSLMFVQLVLPLFNEITEKDIHIFWESPLFWLCGIAFSLVTGFLAASYPALYLSSFVPVRVLKGTFRAGRHAALPRKILVVLQFTVSITLIIGITVILRQIEFAKSRSVGYNKSGLIEVSMNTPELYTHLDALRDDVLKSGAAEEMSASSGSVTMQAGGTVAVDWNGKTGDTRPLFMSNLVTPEYGKTIGWEIIEGRDFSREISTDRLSIIINESAQKLMGFKDPLAEEVRVNQTPYKVIAVIKDMIKESPFEPVKPTFYLLDSKQVNVINIRLASNMSTRDALDLLEKSFKVHSPASPFDYRFVDVEYERKFAHEEQVGKLSAFFALLATLISSLGIFGLASFMAEQRTKEIGIKKVLGASVFQLWRMLSRDFVFLVGIALILSTPISYYFMSDWLQRFEYRVDVSWWIFAVAGLCALVITLLTVSYQSIKAAMANPVKSLRSE